jgi:Neurotransmitter-gated ion-channel ligand binding domain
MFMLLTLAIIIFLFFLFLQTNISVCAANPDAKRLYDDLLSNYNKLVRPVVNVTDALTVRIKLKLSQLIDVVSW